jgi:CHAD domain-containing protein
MHEWRKQVKYLRHALQVFAPLRPSKLKKQARLARRLAESLGDGHDLALLRDSAVSSANDDPSTLTPLLTAIDQRRRVLRQQSLELADRVYQESPREIDKRLQRYWHRWRDQSK